MGRAGKYREFIVFKRKVRTDLPSGDYTYEYNTYLQTFCDVDIRNASVDTLATHRDVEQLFLFTVRHRTDIQLQTNDRIVWRGRNYVIHSFTWDVLRTEIEIRAFTENETSNV